MPIDSNPHPDAAHTNPKYDPDEDGDVENVDLENYNGPADFESVNTIEALLKADGALPDKPVDSALHLRGDSSGRGIILQNQDDSATTGPGRANIQWYTDSQERLATVTSHPTHNHLSFYVKQDAVGSGDTGLGKMLDLEGGQDPYPYVQWNANAQEHNFEDHGIIRVSGSLTSGGREIAFYKNLDDATNELQAHDRLILGPETYDPITITQTGVTIVGSSRNETRFDNSDGTAVTIDANSVTLQNIRVGATGTGDGIHVNGNNVNINNCKLYSVPDTHIRVSGLRNLITGITRIGAAGGAQSILFESGSDNCLVDQYLNAGTITDTDGTNTVGTTT